MPDINITAQLLFEMASKKMRELETRMDEVQKTLSDLQDEHGRLYSMAMGFSDKNPAVDEVVTGAANITITKGEF